MVKRLILKAAVCPKCNEVGSIRKIVRGLLFEEPDPNKYVMGGCMRSFDYPDYSCIECDWSGLREDLLAMK